VNYLAHLFLSDADDLHLLGNIAGDWIKGPLHTHDLPPRMLEGVRRHRWVDSTTDSHPAVRNARQLFSPARSRAVPIILDMVFDHLLARNWVRYADLPLEAFLHDSYTALERVRPYWPARGRHILPTLMERDLLGRYRDLAVIGDSLEHIAGRLSRDIGLRGALPEIEANLEALDAIHARVLADLLTQLPRH